jgi:hypothetical protein
VTSLSTVGLGDLHPRSNIERIFISFFLLFGVSVFSYLMGKLIEIIHDIRGIEASICEGDKLSRFFGLLQRFNGGRQINRDMMTKIEDYFAYKWDMDCN